MGCSQRLSSCLRHSARIGPNLLCHPSSIIRHPPSVTCHPHSVIHHPPFVIRRLSSVMHHLSFVIRHPPSFICHLSSVIRHPYFFVRFITFFCTFSLFSPIFCKIKNIFLKHQKFKNKFLLARAIHREHFVVTMFKNIAKGTTDPRVEFISQVAHKS